MFTSEAICSVTSLEPKDIRFVLKTVLDKSEAKVLTSGEALALLVYDFLIQLNFKAEQVAALVKRYEDTFLKLGRELAACAPDAAVSMTTLVVADNRYAFIGKDGYDLTELVAVESVPVPVLSLSIVLPRLYQRAVAVLSARHRQRTEEVAAPGLEVTDRAGL